MNYSTLTGKIANKFNLNLDIFEIDIKRLVSANETFEHSEKTEVWNSPIREYEYRRRNYQPECWKSIVLFVRHDDTKIAIELLNSILEEETEEKINEIDSLHDTDESIAYSLIKDGFTLLLVREKCRRTGELSRLIIEVSSQNECE